MEISEQENAESGSYLRAFCWPGTLDTQGCGVQQNQQVTWECVWTTDRAGRCAGVEQGSVKPVHITTAALQTALEQSCSAEEPVHSIIPIKESKRGQLTRLSVLYTFKLCSELSLESVLFITSQL